MLYHTVLNNYNNNNNNNNNTFVERHSAVASEALVTMDNYILYTCTRNWQMLHSVTEYIASLANRLAYSDWQYDRVDRVDFTR